MAHSPSLPISLSLSLLSHLCLSVCLSSVSSGSIELSELKELLLDPDVARAKSPNPHR
jgi:hypothetical protein